MAASTFCQVRSITCRMHRKCWQWKMEIPSWKKLAQRSRLRLASAMLNEKFDQPLICFKRCTPVQPVLATANESLLQVRDGEGAYKQVTRYHHVGPGRGDFEPLPPPTSSAQSLWLVPLGLLLLVLVCSATWICNNRAFLPNRFHGREGKSVWVRVKLSKAGPSAIPVGCLSQGVTVYGNCRAKKVTKQNASVPPTRRKMAYSFQIARCSIHWIHAVERTAVTIMAGALVLALEIFESMR